MQQPVLIRGELKLRNGKNVKSTEKDPNSDSDRPPEKDREAVHRCLIKVAGSGSYGHEKCRQVVQPSEVFHMERCSRVDT